MSEIWRNKYVNCIMMDSELAPHANEKWWLTPVTPAETSFLRNRDSPLPQALASFERRHLSRKKCPELCDISEVSFCTFYFSLPPNRVKNKSRSAGETNFLALQKFKLTYSQHLYLTTELAQITIQVTEQQR